MSSSINSGFVQLRPFFSPACFHSLADFSQQCVASHRLGQKRTRSRSHQRISKRGIAVTSYENDGEGVVQILQLFLELDPAHAGKADIEHQAARIVTIIASEKFFGRGKRSGGKSSRFQDASQRFPQGFVIVNDSNNSGLGLSLVHFDHRSRAFFQPRA
jgi:phage terminase large subunit-like protein